MTRLEKMLWYRKIPKEEKMLIGEYIKFSGKITVEVIDKLLKLEVFYAAENKIIENLKTLEKYF